MMHKVALAHCAFILLLTAGCGDGGNSKTVSLKELGFEITVPETWAVEENIQAKQVRAEYTKPGKSKAVLGVYVTGIAEGKTLMDMVNGIAAGIQNRYKTSFEMGEKVAVKLAGTDAYKMTCYYDVPKQQDASYFVIVGRRCYMISVSASKSDYDAYANEFDAIVKSFKLIEAK